MSPSVPPTGSAEELKQVELKQRLYLYLYLYYWSYFTTVARLLYLYYWSYRSANVLLWHSYWSYRSATVLLWHRYCSDITGAIDYCGTATVPLLLQVELWHSYVNWEKSNPLKVG